MTERIFQDRDAEIIRLATEENISHAEIALQFGISRPRVSKIISTASHGKSPDEIQLDRLYKKLNSIAKNPEARVTAIGKTVVDPDTGKTIRNRTEVIAAINSQIKIVKERRAQQESEQIDLTAEQMGHVKAYLQQEFSAILADKEAELEAMRSEVARMQGEVYRWQSGELTAEPQLALYGSQINGEPRNGSASRY